MGGIIALSIFQTTLVWTYPSIIKTIKLKLTCSCSNKQPQSFALALPGLNTQGLLSPGLMPAVLSDQGPPLHQHILRSLGR